jgi:DNA-directed RNA polymerase subunit RPC12/RpoP|tara:strand:- start:7214 stop:7447 length:234 start_codon:yes stop_codon:yes gene_type:complete
MVLNDYKCNSCRAIYEYWSADETVKCKDCSDTASKIMSGGNFSLPGIDTGFPTAADKWARRHRKANHAELKELGIPT